MSKKHFLLAVPLIFGLGIFLDSSAQKTVSRAPIGPIWQMERAHLGVSAGQGVALSPDGKAVVYMGEPETRPSYASLVLVESETGKRAVLRASDNFVMPSQPGFSPDGKQVVFVVHGPTWSYSSDIYTVGTDGKGLSKLTESVPCTERPPHPPESGSEHKCPYYQTYYYSPRYSPDGSRILLFVDDEVAAEELTAIMGADGSNLEILAEGRPCCWSADGKAVYYTHKGLLTRMDLETRATRTVPLPPAAKRTPLGRMKGRDWFAFRLGNGRIGWYDFETSAPVAQFLGEWSVPGVKMAGREQLELKGFEWSGSNEVLLWYEGEETERFEVVRIFDPTALSR